MRTLLLATVLGAALFGLTFVTPSPAQASWFSQALHSLLDQPAPYPNYAPYPAAPYNPYYTQPYPPAIPQTGYYPPTYYGPSVPQTGYYSPYYYGSPYPYRYYHHHYYGRW
jgi:hypothetical protein